MLIKAFKLLHDEYPAKWRHQAHDKSDNKQEITTIPHITQCGGLGLRVRNFKATLAKMLAYKGVHFVEGTPEKWVQLPGCLLLELFPIED